MKAAVLVAPMQFELRDVPVPECGASDVHIYHGNYSSDRLPLILGHEFSGTIAEVGSAVKGLKVGQAVTADINLGCRSCFYCRKNEILNCTQMVQLGIHVDGGMAEYVRVPAYAVVPLPAAMPVEEGAMVEPLSCIVRAFRRGHVRLAESVLVIGAGPIGQMHMQLAVRAGAAPVIVVEPNEQRARLAKELGADLVVTDPAQLEAAVRGATDGRGVDVAIESVGSTELYEKAFTLIRPGGLIAVDNTLGLSRTPIIRMTSEHAQAIKEFNRRVHRDPRVEIAMLPVGEGLTLLRVV